jgi:hypothetical protein
MADSVTTRVCAILPIEHPSILADTSDAGMTS